MNLYVYCYKYSDKFEAGRVILYGAGAMILSFQNQFRLLDDGELGFYTCITLIFLEICVKIRGKSEIQVLLSAGKSYILIRFWKFFSDCVFQFHVLK